MGVSALPADFNYVFRYFYVCYFVAVVAYGFPYLKFPLLSFFLCVAVPAFFSFSVGIFPLSKGPFPFLVSFFSTYVCNLSFLFLHAAIWVQCPVTSRCVARQFYFYWDEFNSFPPHFFPLLFILLSQIACCLLLLLLFFVTWLPLFCTRQISLFIQ